MKLMKVVFACPAWDTFRFNFSLAASVVILGALVLRVVTTPIVFVLTFAILACLVVPLVHVTYVQWRALLKQARELAPHVSDGDVATNELPMLIGGVALFVGLVVSAYVTGLR